MEGYTVLENPEHAADVHIGPCVSIDSGL
jgi:hypothetical protein